MDDTAPSVSAKETVARPIDPTAMTPASVTTSTSKTAHRVPIFNPSDTFSPDDGKQLTVFAKPEASRIFLTNALSSHYLFESLEDVDMSKIVDCMKPTFASVDEVIIKQGDVGDLFFCLEVGAAFASVDGKEVFQYEPGGCFGELALIYNSPRAASVTAKSACKLWVLDLK